MHRFSAYCQLNASARRVRARPIQWFIQQMVGPHMQSDSTQLYSTQTRGGSHTAFRSMKSTDYAKDWLQHSFFPKDTNSSCRGCGAREGRKEMFTVYTRTIWPLVPCAKVMFRLSNHTRFQFEPRMVFQSCLEWGRSREKWNTLFNKLLFTASVSPVRRDSSRNTGRNCWSRWTSCILWKVVLKASRTAPAFWCFRFRIKMQRSK